MPRSFSGILARNSQKRADVGYAQYVAPDGDSGNHWVADMNTGDQYVVGSSQGNATLAPGAIVPLGRAGASQAQPKFILGPPPPGIAGGSSAPPVQL